MHFCPLYSGLMSWTHFEQMAEDYDSARRPYPQAVFEVVKDQRVIGPGLKVLEVGAGSGLATRELVSSGSHVVAPVGSLIPCRNWFQIADASSANAAGFVAGAGFRWRVRSGRAAGSA